MLTADALEDPRQALEALIYGVAGMQSRDQGLREVMAADHGLDTTSLVRQRLAPISERVFARAKAAGLLRPEADRNDIPMILWTAGSIAGYAEDVSPSLWRRYVDLLFDGLLAEGVPRHAIAVNALAEPQLESAMQMWGRRSPKA